MNNDILSGLDTEIIDESINNEIEDTSIHTAVDVWTIEISMVAVYGKTHNSCIKNIKRLYEYRFQTFMPDKFVLQSIEVNKYTTVDNDKFPLRCSVLIKYTGKPDSIIECEMLYKILFITSIAYMYSIINIYLPNEERPTYTINPDSGVLDIIFRRFKKTTYITAVNLFYQFCNIVNPDFNNDRNILYKIIQHYNIIYFIKSQLENMIGIEQWILRDKNFAEEMLLRHISHIQMQTMGIEWEHMFISKFTNISKDVLKHIDREHIQYVLDTQKNVCFSLNAAVLNVINSNLFNQVFSHLTISNTQSVNRFLIDSISDFFFYDDFFNKDISINPNDDEQTEIINKIPTILLMKKPYIPFMKGKSISKDGSTTIYSIAVHLGEYILNNKLFTLSLGIKGSEHDVTDTLCRIFKSDIKIC